MREREREKLYMIEYWSGYGDGSGSIECKANLPYSDERAPQRKIVVSISIRTLCSLTDYILCGDESWQPRGVSAMLFRRVRDILYRRVNADSSQSRRARVFD